MSKTVVTCALTGVLTDPAQHHVPVTPEQMAREARAAFDAGASVMHVHFRQQKPGLGHLPSWEPAVAAEIAQAIREACPGVIFNQSTGVVGPDIAGPAACIRAIRPEIAACNAGSLNYLKVRERRLVGVAADAVRQPGREGRRLPRGDEGRRARCPSSSASTPASCARWRCTPAPGSTRATSTTTS